MMRRLLIVIILIVGFSCSYAPAHAQITLPTAPDTRSITLIASPEHPQPLQQVSLQVQSYNIDISGASISWYVNGKKIQSGVGMTSYSLAMGGTGSSITVSVIATISDGTTFRDSVTLSAASVDILWQARSYTPLFYEGKALYTNEGDVNLIAIPNFNSKGATAGSKNYIYTWKKDGSVLGDLSGYGKDAITIKGSIILNPVNVSVDVSTPSGSVVGSNSITLFPQQPRVILYQESPLYGTLYNQALASNYKLNNQEITLQAVPYFFSSDSPHSVQPLSFSWSVNGNQAIVKTTNDLTLRQPGGSSGQSSVSVDVKNPNRILQFMSGSTNINFASQ